jgi:hypothetical protein
VAAALAEGMGRLGGVIGETDILSEPAELRRDLQDGPSTLA